MSYLVAGVVSGLLMAAVFLVVAPLMLFFLFKSRPPWFVALTDRVAPMKLMLGLVVFAYPTWALVGVVLGMVLLVAEEVAPGVGTALFTAVITVGAVVTAATYFVVVRRVTPGPAALTIAFAAIFGWVAAVPGLTTTSWCWSRPGSTPSVCLPSRAWGRGRCRC